MGNASCLAFGKSSCSLITVSVAMLPKPVKSSIKSWKPYMAEKVSHCKAFQLAATVLITCFQRCARELLPLQMMDDSPGNQLTLQN